MNKAKNGEEITIGFFGGSITQGSLASNEKRCYAYRVFQWWESTYPNAKCHYVNGGIGGTSSHFGVARVKDDLLIYQPDFVVVDFSVNDEANEFYKETFEGLIRKVLYSQPCKAVLILNNVFYDTGLNAQDYHNEVAAHYQIPCVSMRDTVYAEMKKGRYTREELTPDGLHPNDRGHQLVADEIIKLLEKVKAEFEKDGLEHKDSSCGRPITANAYEKAQLLNITNCFPKLSGFFVDAQEKQGHLDIFKNGWIGKKQGDRICFELECACIAVQYRKTIQQPSPVARLKLDGTDTFILDGNFEETWGDCLYLGDILHQGVSKTHTVEIEIIQATMEDKVPFYLTALIVA
ncbi:SGNH/GDSL hydrolase family protein [Lachnospiraceae bacterium ZAX-1]